MSIQRPQLQLWLPVQGTKWFQPVAQKPWYEDIKLAIAYPQQQLQ
jgi:hypothetical protein